MNDTKALLKLLFDEPHHDNLRLAHPGTTEIYQYVLNDWEQIIGEDAAFMEIVDIQRFRKNPEMYNTLDVCCARLNHIVTRAQNNMVMREGDNQLVKAISHTLSSYARQALHVSGYFHSRLRIDED